MPIVATLLQYVAYAVGIIVLHYRWEVKHMQITYKVEDGILYIFIMGELDEHAANTAKRQLDEIINNSRSKSMIFNLARLSFMDSTGIGVLIGRYKLAKSRNILVNIANSSRTVDKILTMSGLYQLMPKVTITRGVL